MADQKILLGNVRGEQGPAGPNANGKTPSFELDEEGNLYAIFS